MDCPVCREPFKAQARRPKSLPCGHSLCLGCVLRLPGRQCPQCRQEWTQPNEALPDNFSLLNLVEAQEPRASSVGALWCADCRAPSSGGCLAAHDVRIPAVALRQGVRDLVPRAREQVDGLQEGLPQGFPDNDNLSVLQLLCGAPSTCTLSIRQDDGEAFSAECRLEGEALLQALVVSLGSSGRLLREPRVKRDESRTEASASPPLEDLIQELNLGELSQSAPGARQAEKESTLTLVRQRGMCT